MATISKLKILLQKIEGSIQFKFALTYVAIILAVLIIMNTYPILTAQNMVFEAERTILINHANVVSSSLSAMNSLTKEGVAMVMDLMGKSDVSRILITDKDRLVLYDSQYETALGDTASYDEIKTSLNGLDVFHSAFQGNVFVSRAAVPVMSNQAVIGSVFVYNLEAQQGSIIVNIQNNLRLVSILVSLLAVIMSILFSSVFARRAGSLLRSIRVVRRGDYNHRISIKGNDEFAQLSTEFNSLTDRLEKTEEARKRFVSDASHELRTPLSSIKLLTDSILNTQGIDEITLMEFIGDIGTQAERLSRLSEKLLNLSRLDEQKKYLGTAVNCSEVVLIALRDLQLLASISGITLNENISQDCYIYGNEDELYQVAYNLIENAIKYNNPNGSVYVTVQVIDSRVHLIVEDTGKGIPPEDVDKIFDRFYRVDKARSREKGGSGIGLSIVSEGVKRHGGEIRVENVQNGGARFTVVFLPPRSSDESIKGEPTKESTEES
ncbi:MAG: HAMP domain-containing histidine kinase [Clostridiales bacterium]|nr:HAMP domain-containing histidine kinase [Clostridiales bacterium]